MNVDVVVLHGVAHLLAQQVVVHERLGALRGKLHHHAGRGVGVHVGILARDLVFLDVHNLHEHVARFGFACDGPLVAVGDVLLGHVLACAFHQLHLHGVLNVLHRHLGFALGGNVVSDAHDEVLVLALVGVEHGFADGCLDFLVVEANDATVSFNYRLYHFGVSSMGFKGVC